MTRRQWDQLVNLICVLGFLLACVVALLAIGASKGEEFMQREAVERGHAAWSTDDRGIQRFQWFPACGGGR